jgi:peptide deformylase
MAWHVETGRGASTSSAALRAVGIRQVGDDALERACGPFDLPRQASEARALLRELMARLRRIGGLQPFSKGMGLAAPQIGVARSAAVVQPPGREPLPLLNPRVVAAGDELDEQYEGCLSFFEVRGLVPRPLWIQVAHVTIEGEPVVTKLERGAARLACHEIDHLEGILYTRRMAPGRRPIPVSRYRGTGTPWEYDRSFLESPGSPGSSRRSP